MPRKWLEKIVDYVAYALGVLYALRVVAVTKSTTAPRGMRVVFELLGEEQAGRRHEQVLPTPIRPAGLTAQLFAACGDSIEIGQTVDPTTCVGHVVGARFAPDGDGVWRIVAFEREPDAPSPPVKD